MSIHLERLRSELNNYFLSLSVVVENDVQEKARDVNKCGESHEAIDDSVAAIANATTHLGTLFHVGVLPEDDVVNKASLGLLASVGTFVDIVIRVSQSLVMVVQRALLERCTSLILAIVDVISFLIDVLPGEELDDDDDDIGDDNSSVGDSGDESFRFEDSLLQDSRLDTVEFDPSDLRVRLENLNDLCDGMSDVCLSWSELLSQRGREALEELARSLDVFRSTPMQELFRSCGCPEAGEGGISLLSKVSECLDWFVGYREVLSDMEGNVVSSETAFKILEALRPKVDEFCSFLSFLQPGGEANAETICEMADRGRELVHLCAELTKSPWDEFQSFEADTDVALKLLVNCT